MRRPKVSVVLCTYNGEKFVAQQIESILNQSILPDELIVSDDCSSDNTVDIVSDFARRHPATIRLFRNDLNLGFVENFEKAISFADGEIIFLSDQDDSWFEDKIECMLQPFIDYENVGMVYSNAVITDSALNPTGSTLFDRGKSLMSDKALSAPMLMKEVGINGCTMAFNSALRELVLPIGKGWGHDHWIAFIAHAVMDVMFVDKPLICYRRHGNSAGNNPFLEGGRIKVWKAGMSTVSLDEYERDLQRWKVMSQRLHEIMEKPFDTLVDCTNLVVFQKECERRTKLAWLRKRMKKKSRLNRFPDIFHIFSSGYYHRYLHGIKSLTKDLLIR